MKCLAKARFEHDCDGCEYLGQHDEFDMYYCRPPVSSIEKGDVLGGSVIARYSSKGSEYKSSDLAILILGALEELAHGIGFTKSDGTSGILPPRQGEALHVAAAYILRSDRFVELRYHRVDPKW